MSERPSTVYRTNFNNNKKTEKTVKSVGKSIGDIIYYEKSQEERLKRQAERNLSGPERNAAGKLNMMGRKAYFDEYYYNIALENQVFEQIPGIEDVTSTKSFQNGYQRGAFLVSVGNVPEEYQNINNSNKHR